jgi:hypothetical protein
MALRTNFLEPSASSRKEAMVLGGVFKALQEEEQTCSGKTPHVWD